MSRRARVAAGLGTGLTLFGVLVLLVPSVLAIGPGAWLERQFADIDPLVLMLLAGIGMALYLGVTGRAAPPNPPESDAVSRFQRLVDHPPERITADGQLRAGGGIDADAKLAIEAGGEPYDRICTLLGRTATDVYAASNRLGSEAAVRAVQCGEWTDDDVAGWVLAEDTVPPRAARLHHWLRPNTERRRRIERVLTAIEAQSEEP